MSVQNSNTSCQILALTVTLTRWHSVHYKHTIRRLIMVMALVMRYGMWC